MKVEVVARPRRSSLTVLMVSVDVKQHWTCELTEKNSRCVTWKSRWSPGLGGRPSVTVLVVSVDVKHNLMIWTCETEHPRNSRAVSRQSGSRGGRPGLPVPNSPSCGLCGRKAAELQLVKQRSRRGGADSSVVRAPDSWLKGLGFESLLERRENFLLQGRLSVLTLISVSVPPPCYHSST